MHIAPTFSQDDFEVAANTVLTGSYSVYSILITNIDASNARYVTVTNTAGTTIAVISAPVSSSFCLDTPFRTDGLILTSSATDTDLSYTVFHSATTT